MAEVLKRHNHYVPEMYLNNWAHDKRIFTYLLLTSHADVPVWNPTAVKNTASIDNLYVRRVKGSEIDDFEDVFMRRYETPAKEPLDNACSNQCLSQEDWHILIDYVAAQVVRTPAFFFRTKDKMKEYMPSILDSIGEELKTVTQEQLETHTPEKAKAEELIPISVNLTETMPDDEHQCVEIKTVVGKSLWLFCIEYLLSDTAKVLHKHKWSIISAAEGVKWPTSDDPVICLNYYEPGKYDFGGGWERKGTEIFFPICPTKALYTQVGYKHPPRISFDVETSVFLKKIIAEHAFMFVYASEQDEDIPVFHPRTVDLAEYNRVANEFEQWYDMYTEQEVPLLDNRLVNNMQRKTEDNP